jgi:hypothetical protein
MCAASDTVKFRMTRVTKNRKLFLFEQYIHRGSTGVSERGKSLKRIVRLRVAGKSFGHSGGRDTCCRVNLVCTDLG